MSIDYSDMKFAKPVWKKKEPKKPKWQQRQKKPLKSKVAAVQRKKRSKRKKHRKVPSIMQSKDDRRCYLCMLLEHDYREHSYLEEHHVLFGNTKWVSDEYGLRVNLCLDHRRTSAAAVHNNQENAEILMRIAQEKFIERYPDKDWMEIVGKNYLEEKDENTEENN